MRMARSTSAGTRRSVRIASTSRLRSWSAVGAWLTVTSLSWGEEQAGLPLRINGAGGSEGVQRELHTGIADE
ncbi:hypothetical protein GCM10018777_64370 [Streptomyces albogriseolus]|nr:hypothetical protein GCM10018777_64370 [Streptomyces viridodiastaticus]